MVKKVDHPHSYTTRTDPETGRKIWVPDMEATCFEFDDVEVDKWAREGTIPKEIAEPHLAKIREHSEFMLELKKRYGPNPTAAQRLDLLRERHASRPEDWLEREIKHVVNFQEFLEKNWERLAEIIPAARSVRHSRDLVDNKFPSEIKQLSNHDSSEVISEVEPLELSEAQDRLIFTLCQLLAKKSERWQQDSGDFYMGNYEKGLATIGDGKVETARLLVSPYELAKEYYGRNNFNSDHTKHLMATIHELKQKQFALAYAQRRENRGKVRYDRIRLETPLFQLAIVDEDLPEREFKSISGNKVHETKSKLLFKFNPIFTGNITQRYVEFPEDLHLRIAQTKAAGARGRVAQHTNLMRDYLLRELQVGKSSRHKRKKDKNGNIIIERDETTLVQILGLQKEWKAGRKSRVRNYFKKSFGIFLELGLLIDVQKVKGAKGQLKYQITINSDFK